MEWIIFYVVFMIVVYIMADKRNRRPWLWLLIAFFISPVGAGALLLALGKSNDYL